MKWNKLSSGIKGSIIFGIIGIVVFLIHSGSCKFVDKMNYFRPGFCPSLDSMTINLYSSLQVGLARTFFNYYAPFLSFILTVLLYGCIGFLIGWVIGKIKHRK